MLFPRGLLSVDTKRNLIATAMMFAECGTGYWHWDKHGFQGLGVYATEVFVNGTTLLYFKRRSLEEHENGGALLF